MMHGSQMAYLVFFFSLPFPVFTFTAPPIPFWDFYFFTYVYILPFRGLYSYLHHLRLLWVDDCCCPLFERYH